MQRELGRCKCATHSACTVWVACAARHGVPLPTAEPGAMGVSSRAGVPQAGNRARARGQRNRAGSGRDLGRQGDGSTDATSNVPRASYRGARPVVVGRRLAEMRPRPVGGWLAHPSSRGLRARCAMPADLRGRSKVFEQVGRSPVAHIHECVALCTASCAKRFCLLGRNGSPWAQPLGAGSRRHEARAGLPCALQLLRHVDRPTAHFVGNRPAIAIASLPAFCPVGRRAKWHRFPICQQQP